MTQKTIAIFESLRSIAFGSITANYTAVGGATQSPVHAFRICNGTNADMLISLDGSTNHIRVPANAFVLWDISTNRINPPGQFHIPENIYFYVKYVSAPTSGTLWIEVLTARPQ